MNFCWSVKLCHHSSNFPNTRHTKNAFLFLQVVTCAVACFFFLTALPVSCRFTTFRSLWYLSGENPEKSWNIHPVLLLILNNLWCKPHLIAALYLPWYLSFHFLLMIFWTVIQRIYVHSVQTFHHSYFLRYLVSMLSIFFFQEVEVGGFVTFSSTG